jgi:hypothetical protein
MDELPDISISTESEPDIDPSRYLTIHQSLQNSTSSHTHIPYDKWGSVILGVLDSPPSDYKICRVARFYLKNDEKIYIIAQDSEVISSEAIRQLTGELDFMISSIPNSGEAIVPFSELFTGVKSPQKPPMIAVSNEIHSNRDDTRMILQYTSNSSIFLKYKNFRLILSSYFRVKYCNPSMPPPPLPPVTLNTSSDIVGIFNMLLAANADSHDYHLSVVHAQARQRMFTDATLQNVLVQRKKDREENVRLRTVISNLQDKLGRTHEQVVRLAVSTKFGVEWGQSIRIEGINDTFNLVANGLCITGKERTEGVERFYRRIIKGFRGFEEHPHEINEEKDFRVKFLNVRPMTDYRN